MLVDVPFSLGAGHRIEDDVPPGGNRGVRRPEAVVADMVSKHVKDVVVIEQVGQRVPLEAHRVGRADPRSQGRKLRGTGAGSRGVIPSAREHGQTDPQISQKPW